jgi:hypothetical protein
MDGVFLYSMYLLLGLVSGTLGGMIGIGGGAIVVPALTVLFYKDMQLAVAASLVQMVFVASSSAYGHWKNGYMLKAVIVRLVPIATVCAIIGVLIASHVNSAMLQKIFAVFLVYTAGDTTYRLVRSIVANHPDEKVLTEFKVTNEATIPAVAVPMGLSCGVLGIGGGSIAVPAMHMFLKLPLKNAIANSTAAIFFSSIIASVVKAASIDGMTIAAAGGGTAVLHWYDAVVVGLLLAPGSFVGGRLGAHLAKHSPTKVIRAVFIMVLLYSAKEMWAKSQARPKAATPAPAAIEAPATPGNPGAATQ